MRLFALPIITLFVFQLTTQAQQPDSVNRKNPTINGICLCQTTLASLKKSNTDLKEDMVEEMDLPANCYGQDSRFIACKGYSSTQQPGIIFQKDQTSDYISKIRLTKEFKGKLPDGKFVDIAKLQLKDLLKLYPQLKDKWGSRGCSNYWNFSNDTVSFYVKIDTNKKPQFPIDESYYLNSPIEAVDITLSCYNIQKDDASYHVVENSEKNTDPIFFIDSVQVEKSALAKYDSNDIATVTVYKDTNAVKKFGSDAKYGLIYIETKSFDIRRFQNYFKLKSPEYAKLIASSESGSKIQYILNEKVLKDNYEGDLASIDNKRFEKLTIIDKVQLHSEYGVDDKSYGVVINTVILPNLRNNQSKP